MLPPTRDDGVVVVTGASSGIGDADRPRIRPPRLPIGARGPPRRPPAGAGGRTGRTGTRAVRPISPTATSERRCPIRSRRLAWKPTSWSTTPGSPRLGPVAASDPEAELTLVEVDVAAVVDLCSRFVPGMVERGRGAVLNVASVGAFGPVPGQASYGAAKAFVLSYTQAMREELRGTGVTAATLCPGPVKTGFGEAAGHSGRRSGEIAAEVHVGGRRRRGQGRGRRSGVGQECDSSRCAQPDRVGGQPLLAAAGSCCRSSRATIPG